MDNRVHYFIRMPGEVSATAFSEIEDIARKERLSFIENHEVSNVPVCGGKSNISLCDGMQMVFQGDAQDGFDRYITENNPDVYVSHSSDRGLWILRTSQYIFKLEEEMKRDFNLSVMSARVASELHKMSSKRGPLYSAESSSFIPEIANIIEEASLRGIKNTANYVVYAGIPHERDMPSDIHLVDGTEIVLAGPSQAGPLSERVNNLKFKHPYTLVHVGSRLVA